MVYLIAGATHAGKTLLAQKLLEKYKYPYLSIDHLKMGLIRSGNTDLTPLSDDKDLTDYLWPIVKEIVKTAVENNQNLIVEGCYIPFDWAKGMDVYLDHIQYRCIIMSEKYIRNHFDDIRKYENVIEERLCDACSLDELISENNFNLEMVKKYDLEYDLIDDRYEINI